MGRLTRVLALVLLVFVVFSPASAATAHDDRTPASLTGQGTVPTYRTTGPTLLVCGTDKADFDTRVAQYPAELKTADTALWTQCQKSGYRTLQAAVSAVNQVGMIIKLLPGVYQEAPSLTPPSPRCANLVAPDATLGYQVLTWDQQVACPNLQNLVAIQSKRDLQIEGTGAKPTDVVIDAQYQKLMAVRVDRSPGLYLRNFTAEHTTSTGVYLMESDGFAVDHVTGRWNNEDGVDAFADDHGLITDCETYGNGYAGLAAEATPDTGDGTDRFAVEIRTCTSHDNLLGYAGIGGDSVHLHDNTFTNNSAGMTTLSASAQAHPGLPQNHATVEHNIIANNNSDYYHYVRDGTCQKPPAQRGADTGVVCPTAGVPVGTGVVNAGGNDDVWTANWVYNNRYAGFMSWWVPGYWRADDKVGAQFDTSHRNRYLDNTMGRTKDGVPAPNGVDFWWDGQGVGSCWQRSANSGADPRTAPHCDADDQPTGPGTRRYVAEPVKALKLYVCSRYDLTTGSIPTDCDWYGATGLQRVEVKWTLGGAALISVLALALWARLLRGRRSAAALAGLLFTLTGLGLGVYGTLRENTLYAPIGLAVVGLGWLFLGVATYRRGRPALAWLMIAIAVFAWAGAVDQGLVMIPYIPVPPSLIRLTLEVVWVPWAVVAAIRGRLLAGASEQPDRSYDALERYTESLRW